MNWTIEKTVKKGDYIYAVVPKHPNSTKNGYVLLHRILIENMIGRMLEKHEVVHHKNKNKRDNTLENLEIKTVAEHAREHALAKGRKYVELKCPECAMLFEKPHTRTHLACKHKDNYKATFCSLNCARRFNANIQHHGISEEKEYALKNNVVREFRKFFQS